MHVPVYITVTVWRVLIRFVSSLRAKPTLNQVPRVSTLDIIENVKNSKYRYRKSQVSNFSIISSIEPAVPLYR